MSPQTCVANVETQLKSNTFTRDGYTFLGWSLNDSSRQYASHNDCAYVNFINAAGKTYTMFAVWQKNPEYVTVSFVAPDNWSGEPNPNSRTYLVGGEYYLFPYVVRYDGYEFAGWFTSSSGGVQIREGDTVTKGVTALYAHWVKVVYYDVYFNANGGSVSTQSKTIPGGSPIGDLPTPTRNGYSFDGWYTSSSGGTKISSSTTIYGTTTYYAHWVVRPDGNGFYLLPGGDSYNLGRVDLPLKFYGNGTDDTILFEPSRSGTYTVTFRAQHVWGDQYSAGLIIYTQDKDDAMLYIDVTGQKAIKLDAGKTYTAKVFKVNTVFSTSTPNQHRENEGYNLQIGGNAPFFDVFNTPEAPICEGLEDHMGVRMSWKPVKGATKYYIVSSWDSDYKGPQKAGGSSSWVVDEVYSSDRSAYMADGRLFYVRSAVGCSPLRHGLVAVITQSDGTEFASGYVSTGYRNEPFFKVSDIRWNDQGKTSGSISMFCNTSWRAVSDQQWLSINNEYEEESSYYKKQHTGDAEIYFTLALNNEEISRTANMGVEISPDGGDGITNFLCRVAQSANSAGSVVFESDIANVEYSLACDTISGFDGLYEILDAYASSGWSIAVSGLPGGINYDATVRRFSGNATREGNCILTISATRNGTEKQVVKVELKVVFPELSLASESWGDTSSGGKVFGGGKYQAGKSVTLIATPNNGSVFAGWYKGGERLTGNADYRTSRYSYKISNQNETIVAKFATVAEDEENLSINIGEEYTTSDNGSFTLYVTNFVTSITIPKIVVSGLPTGLKFDANNGIISGEATQPGVYNVTVKATNTTVVRTPETSIFKLTVPNWRPKLFDNEWLKDNYSAIAGVLEDSTALLGGLGDLINDGWSIKVSGLPTGMSYKAATKTQPMAITGTATKEGDYTMYIEASKKGETTQKATATISVTFPELKVVSENEDRGTVTGGGKYPAGKKVTLKATAKKGYVFAGWYVCDDPLEVEGSDDYRKASYSYTTTAEATTITGKFVTVDEDKLEEKIILHYEPLELYAASNPVDEKVVVESYSLPSVSVANLPTGMKFDAKTMKITGAPSKQGEQKNVTFTIKNESNKTGKQVVKTMRVGDAVAKDLDLLYNKVPGVDGYDLLVPGAKVDKDLLGMGNKLVGWSVSGLPAGVKFDSKTGEFSGAATKSGTKYLVTLTKGSGSEKQTATITLETKPDPKLVLMKYLMLRGDDDKNEVAEAMAEFPSLFVVSGGGNYPVGKKVTISATAPEDWVFLGWMEPYDCIGDKTKLMQFAKYSKCTIEMPTPDENNEVRLLAVFTYLADDIEVYTEDMQ